MVDLRTVNEHFAEHKVKFENLAMLRFAHTDLTYGAKVDLSDAYHHIALHPSIRKFFQFQIDGEFFECVAIPFGWSLAPYVFTKFTRPILTAMRYPHLAQEGQFVGTIGNATWHATDYYI